MRAITQEIIIVIFFSLIMTSATYSQTSETKSNKIVKAAQGPVTPVTWNCSASGDNCIGDDVMSFACPGAYVQPNSPANYGCKATSYDIWFCPDKAPASKYYIKPQMTVVDVTPVPLHSNLDQTAYNSIDNENFYKNSTDAKQKISEENGPYVCATKNTAKNSRWIYPFKFDAANPNAGASCEYADAKNPLPGSGVLVKWDCAKLNLSTKPSWCDANKSSTTMTTATATPKMTMTTSAVKSSQMGASANGGNGFTLTFHNFCPEPVLLGYDAPTPCKTSFNNSPTSDCVNTSNTWSMKGYSGSGAESTISVSVKNTGKWVQTGIRFWPRTGCVYDESLQKYNTAQCMTGNCVSRYDCGFVHGNYDGGSNNPILRAGANSVSLLEVTFNTNGIFNYDISLVDMFTVGIDVKPQASSRNFCQEHTAQADCVAAKPTALADGTKPANPDAKCLWKDKGNNRGYCYSDNFDSGDQDATFFCQSDLCVRDIVRDFPKLCKNDFDITAPGEAGQYKFTNKQSYMYTGEEEKVLGCFSNCGQTRYPMVPDAGDTRRFLRWAQYCCMPSTDSNTGKQIGDPTRDWGGPDVQNCCHNWYSDKSETDPILSEYKGIYPNLYQFPETLIISSTDVKTKVPFECCDPNICRFPQGAPSVCNVEGLNVPGDATNYCLQFCCYGGGDTGKPAYPFNYTCDRIFSYHACPIQAWVDQPCSPPCGPGETCKEGKCTKPTPPPVSKVVKFRYNPQLLPNANFICGTGSEDTQYQKYGADCPYSESDNTVTIQKWDQCKNITVVLNPDGTFQKAIDSEQKDIKDSGIGTVGAYDLSLTPTCKSVTPPSGKMLQVHFETGALPKDKFDCGTGMQPQNYGADCPVTDDNKILIKTWDNCTNVTIVLNPDGSFKEVDSGGTKISGSVTANVDKYSVTISPTCTPSGGPTPPIGKVAEIHFDKNQNYNIYCEGMDNSPLYGVTCPVRSDNTIYLINWGSCNNVTIKFDPNTNLFNPDDKNSATENGVPVGGVIGNPSAYSINIIDSCTPKS